MNYNFIVKIDQLQFKQRIKEMKKKSFFMKIRTNIRYSSNSIKFDKSMQFHCRKTMFLFYKFIYNVKKFSHFFIVFFPITLRRSSTRILKQNLHNTCKSRKRSRNSSIILKDQNLLESYQNIKLFLHDSNQ